MEIDNDCLQGLLLAPLDRGNLYIGKVASNFTFMMIAEVIVLPIFVIFNNLKFNLQFLEIAGIAVLGTFAIAAIGSILSTISANTRMKEVMLPVLQIPLTVPVVISSVEATSMVLSGDTKGISSWLYLLAGFSIVYLTVSYLVFEFVVAERNALEDTRSTCPRTDDCEPLYDFRLCSKRSHHGRDPAHLLFSSAFRSFVLFVGLPVGFRKHHVSHQT